MKLSRLRGRKSAEFLRRRGDKWKGKTMMIHWLSGVPKREYDKGVESGFFVGTFAPIKLHKSAVKRNRMRRRCREALRTEVKEIDNLPPTQLLLCPRSSSLDCDYGDIVSDVRSFLSHLQ